MNLLRFRASAVLGLVAIYVILNQGFMLVRIPPGGTGGVPLGECMIALFLATFAFELHRLPPFARVAPLMPLLIWWSTGAVAIFIGVQTHGMWALRDATHMIESLFLWIGFVVAASPQFFERFSRWLRILLNIGAVYALFYPVRETLVALSPRLHAPAGYMAPLLFNYISGSLVPLTAAMAWLVDRVRPFGIPAILLAGGYIVYIAAVFQMRTTYLQVIALLMVLVFIQPRVAARLSAGLAMGVLGLALLLAAGVEITGRLGEKFTIDFFFQHFAAIWGGSDNAGHAISGAEEGLPLRLRWWWMIWLDLNASLGNFVFGLGYGMPLTDFIGPEGSILREPHNSVISVAARTGLVGLLAFVWLHLSLVRTWFGVYRWCLAHGETTWRNNLLIMGVFFLMLWVYSIGEDAFEKPYNAIPYYFFWGVILRVKYEILAAARASVPAHGEPAAMAPHPARAGHSTY